MLVNVLASLVAPALAAAPPPPEVYDLAPEPPEQGPLAEADAPLGVIVALRAVGELWHDTAIASTYRGGGVVPVIGAVVPLSERFALDADIGYHRVASTGEAQGALQLVPMSLLFEVRLPPAEGGALELFAGAGPAMLVWSESGQDPSVTVPEGDGVGPTVLRGARPGVEVRLGARIDLDLIEESMMPGKDDALRGVAVELLGARRFAPSASGFNLNTWRVGAGLALVF